jgi:hypothetical protein
MIPSTVEPVPRHTPEPINHCRLTPLALPAREGYFQGRTSTTNQPQGASMQPNWQPNWVLIPWLACLGPTCPGWIVPRARSAEAPKLRSVLGGPVEAGTGVALRFVSRQLLHRGAEKRRQA